MKQGIQRHLGHKTFAKQSIIVPPIELQKRFKDTIDFVTGLSDCNTLTNENFNALTQELLTR